MSGDLRGNDRPTSVGKVSKEAIERRLRSDAGDFSERFWKKGPEGLVGFAALLLAAWWTRDMNGFQQTVASLGAGAVAGSFTNVVRTARRRARLERDMLSEQVKASNEARKREVEEGKARERALLRRAEAAETALGNARRPRIEPSMEEVYFDHDYFQAIRILNLGKTATFYANVRIVVSNTVLFPKGDVIRAYWENARGVESKIPTGGADYFRFGQCNYGSGGLLVWRLSLFGMDEKYAMPGTRHHTNWIPGYSTNAPIADLDITITSDDEPVGGPILLRVRFGPDCIDLVPVSHDEDRRATVRAWEDEWRSTQNRGGVTLSLSEPHSGGSSDNVRL